MPDHHLELRVAERRISISRTGRGPSLLCLPGGPGFPGDQLGDLGGLAETRTLDRVDWRGAGRSDAPADGRHGLADYAADLASLQDQLGIERLTLFGHSFGGLVAATYAARFPDRVATLILDGTPDQLGDGRAPQNGMQSYFARWDDTAGAYVDGIMASLFEPAGEWFGEHEYSSVDLRPALGAITARTLVVTGDHDWAAGREAAEQMARDIPGAEVAVIPDAGHFAWVEQPKTYADRLAAFLGG